MMKLETAVPQRIHEVGQRANQEDNTYPDSERMSRVYILCDGMGGHAHGEVASRIVCTTMGEWMETHRKPDDPFGWEQFDKALFAAYDALDAADDIDDGKKMGTTMTFLLFHANGVSAAHIGDSRIYQLRPASGGQPASILFRTRDHSLVNDLVRLGEMTEEEARTAPNRNIITRAMQPHQARRARADLKLLTDVKAGDYFYLCSDGMTEQMDDAELLALITDPGLTDTEKREELVRRTARNKDNHTAFLIRVTEAEGTAAADPDTPPMEVSLCREEAPQRPAPRAMKLPQAIRKQRKADGKHPSLWRILIPVFIAALLLLALAIVKFWTKNT